MAQTRYADALTLDQLELFITVVETGSFSAAARRLRRAQSAVSYGVKRLEELLGLELLERSLGGARPTLQGQNLLVEARDVIDQVDRLRAAGRAYSEQVEPEVSISLTLLYPLDVFGAIARELRERFPHTTLRVHSGNLGAAEQDVLNGRTTLGISGLPDVPSELVVLPCGQATLARVASPAHPLAKHRGVISSVELRKHLQLVGMDLTKVTSNVRFNVISPRTWRIGDTMIRYQMVLAGAGWTHLPRSWVAADIAAGRLVELRHAKNAPPPTQAMRAFYRISTPPGPVGQWLLDRVCNAAVAEPTTRPHRSRPRRRRG